MTSSHQNHTPAAEEHFDLIIIGTGSGNSIPSPEFDDQKIAIIEKGTFGGTCLNVGCIPTKMYVYAADIAVAAREAGRLGLDAQVNSVDWDSIVDRVFTNRIDQIARTAAGRKPQISPYLTSTPALLARRLFRPANMSSLASKSSSRPAPARSFQRSMPILA